MRFIRQKSLTTLQQLYGLKKSFPHGKGNVERNCLRWDCAIQPTPLSRQYDVRITYKFGSQPSVFVLRPSLNKLAEGRKIPHLYSQKKEKLCLYRPKYGEWNPTQHLVKTIVPWIYLWLFYFEEWVISNDWKGGGDHPPQKD